MQYTVKARGVCKSFGDHAVLDRVDLTIETGLILGLLGPNGAGKTTLVRVLATLVRPDAGAATVAGHDLLTDPVGVRSSISLTGQYAAVDDLLTGQENLEMMARLRRFGRRAARARTEELLGAFDLLDARHRRASTYSGGMRRRLDLAMSMVERPRLLFLDEPTTGLDPHSREQVWGTVRRLAEEGVTILLTTQYLEEADQLADTIVVLDEGRVVASGSAEELKARLGAEVLRLQFAEAASYERAVNALDPVRTDDRLAIVEIASDGTAAHVLATLSRLGAAGAVGAKVSTPPPEPRRGLLVAHRPFRSPSAERGRLMTIPAILSDSRVLAARCLRRSLRNPETFFTALMLPIILMLLFVYVFGGDLRTSEKYVDYVVPGLIVLCAAFGAGTTAVAVATDMSNGIIDRIRSMPVAGATLLVGHVVASLARNLIATTLVIGVGLGLGWRPTGSALDWVAASGGIVFFVFALSWLAAAVGLLAGSAEAATSFTMVLMFIPYVSTAFVPAHTMPAALSAVARDQPFTSIIETMRGLWMGHTSTGAPVGHEAGVAATYSVIILAASAAAASWLFRHRTSA